MIGRAHLCIGAGAGAATTLYLAPKLGINVTPQLWALQTITSAGAALLPDLDSKGTATSTIGIIGKGINKVLLSISEAVFKITKSKYDRPPAAGKVVSYHRTLTHTILFSIIVSFLYYSSVIIGGKIAVGLWLGFIGTFVYTGIIPNSRRKIKEDIGTYPILIIGLASGFGLSMVYTPGQNSVYVLSIAFLAGYIGHIFPGDWTEAGTALFWPLPIAGKRWFYISNPIISAASKFWNLIYSIAGLSTVIICSWFYLSQTGIFRSFIH